MPRSEKQRLRRKAKARSERLHPQPGPLLTKVVDATCAAIVAKGRP